MSRAHSQTLSSSNETSLGTRVYQNLLFYVLKKIEYGQLKIIDGDHQYCFGDSTSALQAEIHVQDRQFYRRVVSRGSIGAGESFMEGHWHTPNLTRVIEIFARNMAVTDTFDNLLSIAHRVAGKILHGTRANSLSGSKKNISAHYDLSNDFFELFLDPTMMYSSAIFKAPGDTLEAASIQKLRRICEQLKLGPDDHLLEIGTGWGSMAIYAAQHYGCRVTTTTLSKEQFAYTQQRIQALGLEQQITLLLEDYRNLQGQYSKLVSIEMIEAVGHRYLGTYLEKCSSLLSDDGLMMIQAITIPDQRYDYYRKENDFIKQYIFPGGHLPSLAVVSNHIKHRTNFQVVDLYDMGLDYAQTLHQWNLNLKKNRAQAKSLGFDEQFLRMWEFYFCYCEGGFLQQNLSTLQILLAKPHGKIKKFA